MLSKQQAHTEYYKQWQKIPVPPELWQNEPAEAAHPARRKVAELIKQANCKTVLEVACGIGVDYPFYHEADITYFGVDITPKFIAEAQRRGVPSKIADALKLPFPDESFDAVYCKDLLIHLPGDWKKALKEMARTAKKVVVVVDDAWYSFTSYMPREKYLYQTEDGGTDQLCFFNNVYGEEEVREYAEKLGLTVEVYDGGTVKRIRRVGNSMATLTVDHPSQITVYRKKPK